MNEQGSHMSKEWKKCDKWGVSSQKIPHTSRTILANLLIKAYW